MTSATTDAATSAADIAHRCERAKFHASSSSWSACCPAHDDRHASLSLSWDHDKVLLHCHAGCNTSTIVQALGLTLADLFVEAPQRRNAHDPIVKAYDYVDVSGSIVHQTVRYASKQFKQRHPHPTKPGAYIWNLKGIEPVLYNLPAVLAAVQQGQTIYVVEGERDAETLIRYGLTATTNPMGAGKWRASYNEALRGTAVVLFPDNDTAGREHVVHVARSLDGIARSITIVPLPGVPEKGDVTDWLQSGKTLDDLLTLVTNTAEGLSSYLIRESGAPAHPHKIRAGGVLNVEILH